MRTTRAIRIPDSAAWWVMVLVSCIAIASNSGCAITSLDRALNEMTQSAINTGLVMVEAVEVIGKGSDAMADAKHRSDDKVIALTDEKFWGRHTSKEGGLVSLNAAGEEEPIKLADVKAFIAKREASLVQKRLSEDNWNRHKANRQDTLAMYKQSLLSLKNANKTIWEKRQSAEAAANRTIGLFGTAVAIGLGAVGG